MIDSKDLRLGNLIYGPSDREETIVAIIGEGWVKSYPGKLTEARFDAELKYCSGIPLTEEWLIKLGWQLDFVDKNGLKEFINYKSDLDAINLYQDKFSFNCWENSKCPEYVHQLQNLYHALTGQELQLTQ
jgi:hypothetical protein